MGQASRSSRRPRSHSAKRSRPLCRGSLKESAALTGPASLTTSRTCSMRGWGRRYRPRGQTRSAAGLRRRRRARGPAAAAAARRRCRGTPPRELASVREARELTGAHGRTTEDSTATLLCYVGGGIRNADVYSPCQAAGSCGARPPPAPLMAMPADFNLCMPKSGTPKRSVRDQSISQIDCCSTYAFLQ